MWIFSAIDIVTSTTTISTNYIRLSQSLLSVFFKHQLLFIFGSIQLQQSYLLSSFYICLGVHSVELRSTSVNSLCVLCANIKHKHNMFEVYSTPMNNANCNDNHYNDNYSHDNDNNIFIWKRKKKTNELCLNAWI